MGQGRIQEFGCEALFLILLFDGTPENDLILQFLARIDRKKTWAPLALPPYRSAAWIQAGLERAVKR